VEEGDGWGWFIDWLMAAILLAALVLFLVVLWTVVHHLFILGE
jgi:hypothetical protein